MEATKQHSLVWEYFEKLPTGKARCKNCRKELACTGGNTSGLGRHLDSHHKKLAKVYIIISFHFIHVSFADQLIFRSRRPKNRKELDRVRRGEGILGVKQGAH